MNKRIKPIAVIVLLFSLLCSFLGCGKEQRTTEEDNGSQKLTTEASIISVVPDQTTEGNKEQRETTAPPDVPEKIDYVSELKLNMDSETKKQEVTVKLFVDGDTTHFNVPEEIVETGVLKARYLGVNTPESTGTIEKWGKQASNFTKEHLSSADSIYVESDDENWNFDNTSSHRCLCWIWYRPAGETEYRNLNIELLQEGYAIANNSASNRYGEICLSAIEQAKELKLHVYSNEVDPLFYEGDIKPVTLKALRTNPEPLVGVNVTFDAVITREYSNTLYVEEYDEEDGIYYGMNVYYGFSVDPACMAFLQIGNRVKFVGSLQYYEAGGTYQISGLIYKPRKPEESCQLVEEKVYLDYVLTDPAVFAKDKKTVIVTLTNENGDSLEVEQEFKYSTLALSTAVSMENLTVTAIYTTSNDASSSKGAMTLTCKAADGSLIDIRTVVLHDENGNLVTASAYQDKVIDVRGVVDYYDGSYQIKVFSTEDITVH